MADAPGGDGARELSEILTGAWQEIEHARLPPMQVTTGWVGRGEVYEGRVLPGQWERGRDGVAELALDRRCLRDGAEVVLGTLLHVAVHAILDGGFRGGNAPARYHSDRFLFTADLLGLEQEFIEGRGWPSRRPTAVALTRHHASLEALRAALGRYVPALEGGRGSGGGRQVAIACGCPKPRRFWTFPSTLAGPPVVCTACNKPLTASVA